MLDFALGSKSFILQILIAGVKASKMFNYHEFDYLKENFPHVIKNLIENKSFMHKVFTARENFFLFSKNK